MQRQNKYTRLAALGLVMTAAACADVTEPIGVAGRGPSLTTVEEPVPTGVRIQVQKTVTPEWTNGTRYEWTIAKDGPDDLELPLGQTKSVTYTVSATRTLVGTSEFYGVTGEICINNNGPDSTQGLSVIDKLQYWDDALGDWVAFGPEVAVDVSSHPVLDPFTSHCYPYRIALDPAQVPASKLGYRNTARVFVDNFMEGYEEYAHHQTAPFVFPAAPIGGTTGATASVVDQVTCPAGMTCSATGANWSFSDTGSTTFTISITNSSVPCFKFRDLVNTVKLTAGAIQREASVSTTIWTGDNCAPQPTVGCTPGFWKQTKHAQYWINHTRTDLIGTVFVQAARYGAGGVRLSDNTLIDALNYGGGPREVGAARILLRAAVAALLNTEASRGDVAGLIATVNSALASEDRATMIALAERLDAANNGQCTVKR